MQKDSEQPESANRRSPASGGSPAHACTHNVAKGVECRKPATHHVTRDGDNLEWFFCEEHARQRKGHLYTVTALENDPSSAMTPTTTPELQQERDGVIRSNALLDRAHRILKTKGPMRGSDLGWELWGESTAVPNRGTGSQRHNKFCRAAGKVLRRLERAGRVISQGKETCTVWIAV